MYESALEKELFYYEFNGRLTFVTVSHNDDLFYVYDTRCEIIKALLAVIVNECNMSREQDDFVFCNRRVRVIFEALFISQEIAASFLLQMELYGPQRLVRTVLTRIEYREYRSLLE